MFRHQNIMGTLLFLSDFLSWLITIFPKHSLARAIARILNQTNMALGRLVLGLLLVLSEFPQCSADNEDSFSWDVKDNVKFGVAESTIEVSIGDFFV